MIPVTRWFVKAGIVHLVTGILLLLIDAVPGFISGISLLPVYLHLIVVGWVTQLIMGISIWMFPRNRRDRNRETSIVPWAIFGLLNSGLMLRILSEPFLVIESVSALVRLLTVLSVTFQLTACLLYVFEIWPRLKTKKSTGG